MIQMCQMIQKVSGFLVISFFTVMVSAAGADAPVSWDFISPDHVKQWSFVDLDQQQYQSDGLELLTGNDSQLISPELQLKTGDFWGVEIMASSEQEVLGQLFFATGDTGFSNQTRITFQITRSKVPQRCFVALADHPDWRGTLKKLRVDPATGPGVKMNIHRIRLLGPKWEFNRKNGFDGWSNRDMADLVFSESEASFVSGRDSAMASRALHFSAARYELFSVTLKSDKPTAGELFFRSGDTGFTQKNSISFAIEKSDEFKTYTVDCRKNPEWQGTIAALRFDPASAPGVNIRIQSAKLSSGSAAERELLSETMVGMVDQKGDSSDDFNQKTLTGVDQPVPDVNTPIHNQLNNNSPLNNLNPKRSAEITAGNTFGVAICGNDFFDNSPDVKGALWSPYWLNDREGMAKQHNTVFSSAMHYTEVPENEEYCQIELPEVARINRIVIQQRNINDLTGFPVDFQLLNSIDGQQWDTIADVKNHQTLSPDGKCIFEFKDIPAKFVRLRAQKLRSERGRYYFQIREIEIYAGTDVNLAAAANGGKAFAPNPLGAVTFDYQKFYSDIFESGATWLIVSNERFLARHQSRLSATSDIEHDNAEFLQKNGVHLIYRFMRLPSRKDYEKDPEKVTGQYVEAVSGVVEKMKGKVAVWALANEQNFYGKSLTASEISAYKDYYVKLVGAAAERIRKLDPDTPIEIETALFDFEWTEDVLKAGLLGKINHIGVHVYKELPAKDSYPEAAGAVSKNGLRFYGGLWRNYAEQITAYRDLLHRYDPALKINISETGINTGVNPIGGPYYVSEKSQAKFLSRMYLYNYFQKLGPGCWWSLEPVRTGEYIWGLVNQDGSRKSAWYALRNISAIFDDSCRETDEIEIGPAQEINDFVGKTFVRDDGIYLFAYWAAVKMRDGNTGKAVNINIKGVIPQKVQAVDTLSGTVHDVNFVGSKDGIVLKDMIVRDYPVILMIEQ